MANWRPKGMKANVPFWHFRKPCPEGRYLGACYFLRRQTSLPFSFLLGAPGQEEPGIRTMGQSLVAMICNHCFTGEEEMTAKKFY
jgi:hypothetical protein